MTDAQAGTTVPATGANQGGVLMDIGEVAARNIVMSAEGLAQKDVATVKKAIANEIGAMSSHFTLALSDVQTQYEVEVAKVKSTFSFVKANKVKLIAAAVALLLVGGLVGHYV